MSNTQSPPPMPRMAMTGREADVAAIPFAPHPAFQGVGLRLLAASAQTEGRFSLHQVRVEPGCALHPHRHEASVETHHVLRGSGSCTAGGEAVPYAPGTVHVIASGAEHAVLAGKDGLELLAVFTPPLL